MYNHYINYKFRMRFVNIFNILDDINSPVLNHSLISQTRSIHSNARVLLHSFIHSFYHPFTHSIIHLNSLFISLQQPFRFLSISLYFSTSTTFCLSLSRLPFLPPSSPSARGYDVSPRVSEGWTIERVTLLTRQHLATYDRGPGTRQDGRTDNDGQPTIFGQMSGSRHRSSRLQSPAGSLGRARVHFERAKSKVPPICPMSTS